MSDTPRTDAIVYRDAPMSQNDSDIVDLCRQLERELAEMPAFLEIARRCGWTDIFSRPAHMYVLDALSEQKAAPCDHAWATDGLNPTRCLKCGVNSNKVV